MSYVLSSRRSFLSHLAGTGLVLGASPAWGQAKIELPLPSGPQERPITKDFPQKGAMILQRTRAPLLETRFETFDGEIFTPNDQFYVRWHWPVIPTTVDVDSFRLTVRGRVNQTLSLSLTELRSLPQVELAAVNQCSGNSRGFAQPRVPGAQWANGAMGNARWSGVRLKDVLDRAGVGSGAVEVRFRGLDKALLPDAPDFMKSLAIDHASDGEVMIAFAMNGAPLPLLNGFPLRLIVPGWYADYWIKMLSDIEVLTAPDDNYWTATGYRIPDTPDGNVKPTDTGYRTVPITNLLPRSFITNIKPGATLSAGGPIAVRGIAFGGNSAVAKVDFSVDGGGSWQSASLGTDSGKYGFVRWQATITPAQGTKSLMVRCTNAAGAVQPPVAGWNPGGFRRNVIESVPVTVA